MAVGAAFLAGPTVAQRVDRGVSTGNGFYQRCKVPEDNYAKWTCIAYLRGLADGIAGTWGLGCAPVSATYQQRYDILLKYLTDNPANRHLDMAVLYNAAIFAAFCPSGLPPTIEIEPSPPLPPSTR